MLDLVDLTHAALAEPAKHPVSPGDDLAHARIGPAIRVGLGLYHLESITSGPEPPPDRTISEAR